VRADWSVYEGKRVIRRALDRIPGLERLEPNVVTVSILAPAALAGVALAQRWWLLAALGIAGTMVLATLDGHIAERYGKATRLGGYLNRLVTEVADAITLLGLLGLADAPVVAVLIALTWIVNVAGVLGPTAGGAIQWVGPAAQADRRALLLLGTLVSLVWPLDWNVLCVILIGLLAITAALRARRSIGELRGT
jgi:phosphatidylglycerophosphate synthase